MQAYHVSSRARTALCLLHVSYRTPTLGKVWASPFISFRAFALMNANISEAANIIQYWDFAWVSTCEPVNGHHQRFRWLGYSICYVVPDHKYLKCSAQPSGLLVEI